MRTPKSSAEEGKADTLVAYDAFIPVFFSQFKERQTIEFTTFSEAVDEFFSKIENQKIEIQKTSKEGTLNKRLEKVKLDQNKRINELDKKMEDYKRKALFNSSEFR